MTPYELFRGDYFLRRFDSEDDAADYLQRIVDKASEKKLVAKYRDPYTIVVTNRHFFPDSQSVYTIKPVHS